MCVLLLWLPVLCLVRQSAREKAVFLVDCSFRGSKRKRERDTHRERERERERERDNQPFISVRIIS